MSGWPELRVPVLALRRRDDLAQLRRRGVVESSVSIDEEVEAHDIAITTARVADGSPIRVVGTVEAGLSGIELRATISTTWEGECRRCLEPVTEPLVIEAYATFLEAGPGADDADAYEFDGETVDVGEVVREELMLALPLTPLCNDDCAGADPERFGTGLGESSGGRNEDDADDDAPTIDPRWAPLSELAFDED